MLKVRLLTELEQEQPVRSFAWLHASVLLIGSSLAGFPAVAGEITLDAGPGIVWNPKTPTIKKDDVLVVHQAETTMPKNHGFEFTGTGAPPTIPRCDQGTPAPGTIFCEETRGTSSGYDVIIPPHPEFLRLRALQDLPADMPFQCVVHTGAMTGTLKKAP